MGLLDGNGTPPARGAFDPAMLDEVEATPGGNPLGDPLFDAATPTEPATEEEQAGRDEVMDTINGWLWQDQNLAQVLNLLNQPGDAYEKVARVAFEAAKMAHTKHPEISADVYFGEGGVLQDAVLEVWEIMENEQIPGYDSQDQMQGALIRAYTLAGEYVEATKDEGAKSEAIDLGMEMAQTTPEGELMPIEEMQGAEEML